MAKETLKVPRIIISENDIEENKAVSGFGIKELPPLLRTNGETSQESSTMNPAPRNQRRNKRFEDALLKWQEYGNDIIERKQPHFLELRNKPRKGAWIYAGGKYSERPEVEETQEANNERDELYRKQVKELAGRLDDNVREFQEMRERSAKIELTLKQLKEKAMVNMGDKQDFKT